MSLELSLQLLILCSFPMWVGPCKAADEQQRIARLYGRAASMTCLCCCRCTRCSLVQAKTRELKQNLNNEFRSIHELCMFVLSNTRKVELLRATLTALAAYLSWIPPGEHSQQHWLCCKCTGMHMSQQLVHTARLVQRQPACMRCIISIWSGAAKTSCSPTSSKHTCSTRLVRIC